MEVLIARRIRPLVGPGSSGSTVNVFEGGASMHQKYNTFLTRWHRHTPGLGFIELRVP